MNNNEPINRNNKNTRLAFGLRFKFISAISLLLVITLGLAGYYFSYNGKKLLEQSLENKARAVGQFAALISPEAIYSFDITTLDRYMQQISNMSDIDFAVINSPEGKFMTTYHLKNYSNDKIKNLISHYQGNISSGKVYLLTFPIKDQGTILGQLHVAINTKQLQQVIKSLLIKQLFIYSCIVFFLALVIYSIFHFHVLRPITALIEGSNHISNGDYEHDVTLYANDELGQLTQCFNKMICEIKQDRSSLILSNTRLKLSASVFIHAREGIIITKNNGSIIDVNEAFTHITGYSKEEVIGKNPRILKSGQHSQRFYKELWESLHTTGQWYGDIWNKRKNGEIFPETMTISAVYDSQGEVTHYVALFSDITEKIKHQQQLEHIAHYDALTNLPNRILLADRMRQSIAHSRRKKCIFGVVYLDLDGFKEVNDNYGHEIGDKLLIKLSSLLSNILREDDTLSRVGGDEFVAILNDLTEKDECIPLLERLNVYAAQDIEVENRILRVSASIGISFWTEDNDIEADQLIRQADQAMYQAKLQGKNCYHLFDSEKDENVRGLNEDIKNISLALNNNEFVLFYQPKVNMKTGELIGVEALIRWQHPEKGILSPIQFLPLIENHDLSIELGEWVLKTALTQMNIWHDEGLKIKTSVNISARHLQREDFALRLEELLNQYPTVLAESLQLEILETCALENIHNISKIIHSCNELGVEFALDDFGTGYSSLTYLKRLPASQLKIDKSFVKDLQNDTEDLAVIEGILGLSEAFNRELIAEGVESEEHGIILLNLGCLLGQGFSIAKPMPASKFNSWLKQWKPYNSWKTAIQIQKEDISVLRAIVEHQSWVKAVEDYLAGDLMVYPILDENKCRFSKWLNGEGKNSYSSNIAYHEVVELHSEIHKIARIIIAQNEFDEDDQKENIQKLRNCKNQLISNLKKLF